MTRERIPRRIIQLSKRPDKIFRASLAEDYDGIGQYVSINLSRGSTSAALQGRVASGDFGGGRTFPEGTPVVVFSYRGTLEVFLGNIPGGCAENFNREETNSLGLSEFNLEDWQYAWWMHTERVSISEGQAIFQSVDPLGTDQDLAVWITSSSDLVLPIEIEYELTHEQNPWPPTGIVQSPFLTMGTCWDAGTLYNNNDGGSSAADHGLPWFGFIGSFMDLAWKFTTSRWETLVYDFRLASPVNYPNDPGGGGLLIRTDLSQADVHHIKIRINDINNPDENGRWGTYGKWWANDELEPEDWQSSQTDTGAPLGIPTNNAIVIDDFGTNTTAGESVTKWQSIKVNGSCLLPGFTPSPRVTVF